jgi:hypothetical protein
MPVCSMSGTCEKMYRKHVRGMLTDLKGPTPLLRHRRPSLPRAHNTVLYIYPPRTPIHTLHAPPPRERRHCRRHSHHPPKRQVLRRHQRRLQRKGHGIPERAARDMEDREPRQARRMDHSRRPRPHRPPRPKICGDSIPHLRRQDEVRPQVALLWSMRLRNRQQHRCTSPRQSRGLHRRRRLRDQHTIVRD